ncbi:MAG TPA: mechanosensitive ion channel domain-containing protein [Candidatus Obscuribacterales bacterium]
MHIFQDNALEKIALQKVDVPLQLFLVLVAACPFTKMLPGRVGLFLERGCTFFASFLAVHIIVLAVDLLVFKWYLDERKDANVPSVFRFVVLTVIYLGFGMLLLNAIFGINVMPVLATSTVLTAVLGLALQDTLKNLFAGLTMSFEKRFRQGDWIMFGPTPEQRMVGQVVEIGWRTTKIRTLDENFTVIPNSQFTANQLTNFSSPTPSHAVYVELPMALTVDVEAVRKKVVKAVKACPGISENPEPELVVSAIKHDHVLLRLKFWVDEFSEREAITGRVIEISFKQLSEMKVLPGSAVPAAGDKINKSQPAKS